MYGTAANLAKLNATYTAQSTAIQVAQADRSLYMNIGTAKAAAAGSGGTGGGSAADILRSSTEQSALNRGVLQQQGLITEAGFTEQATSYGYMQKAANVAAQAEDVAATGEQATAQADLDTAKAYEESGTGYFILVADKGRRWRRIACVGHTDGRRIARRSSGYGGGQYCRRLCRRDLRRIENGGSFEMRKYALAVLAFLALGDAIAYSDMIDGPPVVAILPHSITNSLTSDVNLSNTSNFFDGPSVAVGTIGIWVVFGSVDFRHFRRDQSQCFRRWQYRQHDQRIPHSIGRLLLRRWIF